MDKTTKRNDWPLARFIIPAFPELNVFTRQAKKTTALGPIMVATAANKLWGWRVEVIDENNYRGIRNNQGLPDHLILQKENPASVIGFYCGLTSTMERVWQLAEFYHQEPARHRYTQALAGGKVLTIAGGWHAHYCPEETLKNNIDLVVHGDGEIVIQQILNALKEEKPLRDIPAISFLENGQVKTNPPKMLEISDLSNLPYPDFGLLKYAKMKIYPIGRIRGCRMNCEFCSVKGKPRYASSQHLFNVVKWLVETRKARQFFIVDDRLEEDIEGTFEFFKMIFEKYGNRLYFIVQIRLEVAKNTELLEIMKKAGVKITAIGYESPINEDLRAMQKGYSYSHMLEWTKILRQYFWIHGMFMIGYPLKDKRSLITVKEIIRRFRKFIRQASLDSIQILHPIPLVGTDLRQRLEKEGRVFPLELVPWSKYDGNYTCFRPDNMSLREFQEIPIKLMGRFYNSLSFFRIPIKTITLPVDYFIRGWKKWHRDWYRDVIKYGAHCLVQRWQKKQKGNGFVEKLEKYQAKSLP